jgi:hypothetical protein
MVKPILRGVAAGATGTAALASVRRAASKAGVTMPGLAAVLPMAAMGVSDAREWSPSAWPNDLVTHLAYGLTTATTIAVMTDPERSDHRA